ncbi:MAG: GNAT family N-acetyltransferase [Pseudonocardiaceae bacterium]
MLVDQTVTYLEMTSPDQLNPGRVPPTEITLERVGATALPLIRSTHDRIGTPHHWSRLDWSAQRWVDTLSDDGLRSWIARVGAEVAGLLQLKIHPGPEVEISVFGLVPEFVGRGFGGHFLTLAVQLAWNVDGAGRVWLHTSSLDHPHALGNYRKRGFRPVRVERRPREMIFIRSPEDGMIHSVRLPGTTSRSS